MVLFILAVVWAIYLASWFRARRDRRGVNSITTFSKHLSVLERTSPVRTGLSNGRGVNGRPEPIYPAAGYRPPRATMSLSEARRRRRNVLFALLGASVATMVLIPFGGSAMVLLHVLIDLSLAAYVVMLVRTQRLAAERRAKVRYLPQVAPVPAAEPQLLWQQSAN